RVAAASQGAACVVSLTSDEAWTHPLENLPVRCIGFNPATEEVAIGGGDENRSLAQSWLVLWRYADGQLVKCPIPQANATTAVAFASDGRLCLAGLSDGTIVGMVPDELPVRDWELKGHLSAV